VSDSWEFYLCRVEGRPASIAFDLGLRRSAPQVDRPWLLCVQALLRSPRPDGLPDGTEAQALNALEDRLQERLLARCDAVEVGRLSTNGVRELYFYGTGDGALDDAVEEASVAAPGYRLRLRAEEDTGWERYLEFLWPGPLSWQWIKDRRLVDALTENGDTLELARAVDHWAYFEAPDDRERFIRAVVGLGFAAERLEPCARDDEEGPSLGARVTRSDPVTLAHIHGVTRQLYDLAEQHGGSYDGWECPVTRPPA
jgi:hypothetical protein